MSKGGGDPMDLSQLDESDPYGIVAAMGEDYGEEECHGLHAVGPATQCYRCHGYGHTAASCGSPASPKGKGKGVPSQPAYGKGQAKGFKGGKGEMGKGGPYPQWQFQGACFDCGGPHKRAFCPYSAGAGSKGGKSGSKGGKGSKGKGGFNAVSGDWPQLGSHFPTLCNLATAKKQLPTSNRFAVLEEEEEADFHKVGSSRADFHRMGSATLADFMPAKPSIKRAEKCTNKPQAKWPAVAQATGSPRLCPLVTVEPKTLAPVQQGQPEWVPMEVAVDSGASETVFPTDALPGIDLQPSDSSRRGVTYKVANGQEIPNLGQKTVRGVTHDEGIARTITAQVADVKQPLMSVARLVQAGHRVVFDAPGAYIEQKDSRERIWLHEQGGMYMLKLWVNSTSKPTDAAF